MRALKLSTTKRTLSIEDIFRGFVEKKDKIKMN
jgi:hypothetical protein